MTKLNPRFPSHLPAQERQSTAASTILPEGRRDITNALPAFYPLTLPSQSHLHFFPPHPSPLFP
ncbi:MAG: hypothetical protein ACOYNR_15350, partial [Blastocatellia bacterium]